MFFTKSRSRCLILGALLSPSLGLSLPHPKVLLQIAEEENKRAFVQGVETVARYAVIGSGLVGVSYLQSQLTNRYGKHPLIGPFVQYGSSSMLIALSSFLFLPLQSKLGHFLHGGVRDRKLKIKDQPLLEAQWYSTQAHYSVNAQMSRNIVVNYASLMRAHLSQASKEIATGRLLAAVKEVVAFEMLASAFFSDIDQKNPALIGSAKLYLGAPLTVQVQEQFMRLYDELRPGAQNRNVVQLWIGGNAA